MQVAPVNPLYKCEELVNVINQSRSTVLIAHDALIDVAFQAAKRCKNIHTIVSIPKEDNMKTAVPAVSLDDLKIHPTVLSSTVIEGDVSQQTILLPFSSGTTGLPKGVCLSHSNLIANLYQIFGSEGQYFPPDQKLISPLPFFHIYGCIVSNMYCAWQGNTVITMSGRFDLEEYCRLVQEHRPERAHLVPPIILRLAKSPIVDNFDMSSVKMIVSAAAPLSSDVEDEIFERVGSRVKQAWYVFSLNKICHAYIFCFFALPFIYRFYLYMLFTRCWNDKGYGKFSCLRDFSSNYSLSINQTVIDLIGYAGPS